MKNIFCIFCRFCRWAAAFRAIDKEVERHPTKPEERPSSTSLTEKLPLPQPEETTSHEGELDGEDLDE